MSLLARHPPTDLLCPRRAQPEVLSGTAKDAALWAPIGQSLQFRMSMSHEEKGAVASQLSVSLLPECFGTSNRRVLAFP